MTTNRDTNTTTVPHTTYRSAYSSAVVTLCHRCDGRKDYPVSEPVPNYLADDPATCDACGAVYRDEQ